MKQHDSRHLHEEEHLAGTERIFERIEGADGTTSTSFSENVTLIPQPTRSANDPLNWSLWRKYWHATLVLFVTGFTAAISNDAGAASDQMKDALGIDYGVQNTAAGVLFVGIGYWTLLASPMPHLYGRRIQYLICLLFCIGGSIWFAETQNVQDAIWCQLFVGASEACAEALAQQSLSDLFFKHQRGTILGLYILATSVGTFLGPLISGYISLRVDWRWVGWSAAIIGGATLIVFLFGFEETSFHRDIVLQGLCPLPQDVSHNIEGGNDTLEGKESQGGIAIHASSDDHLSDHEHPSLTYWQRVRLITPAPNMIGTGFKQYFKYLFNTLRVFYFPAVVYSGIQWGAQDAWLTFYLTVEEDNWYEPPWSYTSSAVAIMNVPTLIGAAIGCFYGGWFSDYFVHRMAKRRDGISEAEDRLWLMFLPALINPAGLMMFGIGSGGGCGRAMPYAGLAMIGFGWGCAGDITMSYLMDAYPEMILEGMVGVAVINNTFACIFTFVCSDWIHASGLSSTFIAIGVLSFLFHLLTAPMLFWGKAARRWTATSYRNYLHIRDGK
ncbi:MFS general substrate transporter [Polychaeton citri CBS 116435]|uniref:MFS general substrate transporter n=1 Tax=Polychaeton citri CBS 116435 TaxID=1314669 RepID=A0A9P4UPL4_9PEZI|nr:MFS general substrate transporter [Polychaeton citri CBS 116435]